jgi:hypothetical protein
MKLRDYLTLCLFLFLGSFLCLSLGFKFRSSSQAQYLGQILNDFFLSGFSFFLVIFLFLVCLDVIQMKGVMIIHLIKSLIV